MIDLLGRLRGGLDRAAPGRAARALRARPDQEGPRLLQGQPAEGRPGRRARRPTSSCCCSTSRPPGLDPLMEAVFQECVDEVRDAGRTVLLSSHILAEVEALCDRVSIIRAGPRRRDRHPGRAAPPDPHVGRPPSSARAADGLRRPAGGARPRCRRQPGRLRRRHRAPRRGAAATLRAVGIASLTSQPPTLEELFLRHYGDRLDRRPRTTDRDRAPAPGCCGRSCAGTAGSCCGGRSAARCSTGARPAASTGLYTDPGRVRPGRRDDGEQRWRFIAMIGPARALNTIGGQVTWQATGLRRDRRGPDEHVPRRAAHPRRGGVRPRRAAPARRRSAGWRR